MMESDEVDLPTENIVDDGMTLVLVRLEKKKKEAVVILNKYGYDGDKLLKQSPRLDPKKTEPAVTRLRTRERPANTAGSRFCATVGEVLTFDDYFSSKQRCHKRKLDDTEVNYVFSECKS